jgi:hypothetical protein
LVSDKFKSPFKSPHHQGNASKQHGGRKQAIFPSKDEIPMISWAKTRNIAAK